jgi:hypothetical protein
MQYIAVVLLLLSLNGCVKDVKPWQKDTHAKAAMQDGDMNKLTQRFEEHICFIMHPFVKTTKSNFLIPPNYATSSNKSLSSNTLLLTPLKYTSSGVA